MRILLIHPQDALLDGPWVRPRWDRVIDLGRSGIEAYAKAASAFGRNVPPLDTLWPSLEPIHRVRDLLASGLGRLVDEFGLDWWELTAITSHHYLETAVRLEKFAATLGPDDEVHVSRPGFHAQALAEMMGARLHVYPARAGKERHGAGHYARVVRQLPARQLVDIFWDKTDPGYQWRGRFARRPARSQQPFVLLPSAYINVTRTALAYAKSAPDTTFLLVATRRSGWVRNLPTNVRAAWLNSYAATDSLTRKTELRGLIDRWNGLRKELEREAGFRILANTGGFDDFPQRFATALEIRDAWRNVLDREPVRAVLCADDSNPNTHIPLLLAKARGIATVACHHGALDGRYIFKRPHADVVLVKGRMEEDYLVRVCGLPKDVVEIGAPAIGVTTLTDSVGARRWIVFFSETYEVSGGRARDFYGDVLPRLADLALKEKRELVIKLHPFESLVERKRFAAEVLTPEHAGIVRWVSGPLAPELLASAWFAVTVQSTVAMECASRGVPCFLCTWLECWPYRYVDQFTRFGMGIKLERPEQLERIPQMLTEYKQSATVLEEVIGVVESKRLSALLGARQPCPTVLSVN